MVVDTPVTLGLAGHSRTAIPQGSFLWIVNNINFQYFSVLITIVSAVVMVAVSYMTAPPDCPIDPEPDLRNRDRRGSRRTRASWGWSEVAASGVVLVCILGGYSLLPGLEKTVEMWL